MKIPGVLLDRKQGQVLCYKASSADEEGAQCKECYIAHLLLLWTISVGQTLWAELLVASSALTLVFYSLLTALQHHCLCVRNQFRYSRTVLKAAWLYLMTCRAGLAAIYPATLQQDVAAFVVTSKQ